MTYVLVVDEDVAIRALAQTILSDAGYPVTTVGDSLAALATIVAACPAMVVLDPRLPVLRGFEMVVWLREVGITVPIVFMSTEPQRCTEAVASAVDAYLPKPFAPNQFLTLVARLMPPTADDCGTGPAVQCSPGAESSEPPYSALHTQTPVSTDALDMRLPYGRALPPRVRRRSGQRDRAVGRD